MSIDLRLLAPKEIAAAASLLEVACDFDQAATVAQEKLFGPGPADDGVETFSAWHTGELVGVVASAGKWVRLLAVHPKAREQGIGTVLLAAAETAIAGRGESSARTLDQPGNYLAPGIDTRNADTIAWLERRGWSRKCTNTNLIVDLTVNPKVTRESADAAAARCAVGGYDIRRAQVHDAQQLAADIAAAYATTWSFEVRRAMMHTPTGVHLAVHRETKRIAGFAAHDGNNQGLGWFGPAGTFEGHQRRGLGQALLLACLRDVAEAGHPTCTVAWIGPRAFYESCAGITEDRSFHVMSKRMSKDMVTK